MALFSHPFLPCSLSSDPRPNSGRASPGLTTSTVTSTSCAPVHPWRPTSLRMRRREPPHRHSRHRAEAPRLHGSSTHLLGGHLRGEGKRENNTYGLIIGQFTKYYLLLLFSHASPLMLSPEWLPTALSSGWLVTGECGSLWGRRQDWDQCHRIPFSTGPTLLMDQRCNFLFTRWQN